FVDGSLNPVPILTSLSPSRAFSGSGPFTLAVIGSGFTSSSIVQWNGASRPTTFVGATQLSASIGAADVATNGTAQVNVFTASPGGGTSASLTFTIDVGPQLAVSATNVVGGTAVTVTLTGGLRGSLDWLALAV